MSESHGDQNDDQHRLLAMIQSGDQDALGKLFALYRPRLKQMVSLRMDPRLQGRLDASDVVQEAYLDAARRLPDYAQNPTMGLYLWLRFLTVQRLIDLHRFHFGAARRTVNQEIPLAFGDVPVASQSLATQLVSRLTSASHAAMRAETQVRVQQALERLDPVDREVLALRHFELLSNEETAQVLGLRKTAASNRYIRALRRLKSLLEDLPGLAD